MHSHVASVAITNYWVISSYHIAIAKCMHWEIHASYHDISLNQKVYTEMAEMQLADVC